MQAAGTNTSVPDFQRKRTTASRSLLSLVNVAEACRGRIAPTAHAGAEAVLSRFAQ
jgi:hypothetical protein